MPSKALADLAWVPLAVWCATASASPQMELTLIIARIAERLDLNPTTSTLPRPVGVVVNRPRGGTPMLVRERSNP